MSPSGGKAVNPLCDKLNINGDHYNITPNPYKWDALFRCCTTFCFNPARKKSLLRLVDGMDVVKKMENLGSKNGTPSKKVIIAECGEMDKTVEILKPSSINAE
ncbi:unnamed protein product, partial [Iphiclides podalirius]